MKHGNMTGDISSTFLSFVVTSRNDNHGGDLTRRMQIFVTALLEQCERHRLQAELVMVEWNPPEGKEKLAHALRWPSRHDFCDVRIIEVPPELHRTFPCSEALPLFQMISKNAGIRRARGEYILITNIDIIFSHEIMEFFASGRLAGNRMYRVNRFDAPPTVPLDVGIDEQLAFCERNLIRVNERWGTYPLASNTCKLFSPDVCAPGENIFFGAHVYPTECYKGEYFHWLDNGAEIAVAHTGERATVLCMEVEPGPAVNYGTIAIEVTNSLNEVLIRGIVSKREIVYIVLRPSGDEVERYTFHFVNVKKPLPTPCEDPRFLYLKVYRAWRMLPDTAEWNEFARFDQTGFITNAIDGCSSYRVQCESDFTAACSQVIVENNCPEYPDLPYTVHTNACGDFTLMHRDHWFDLRGYPEFTTYSMNIDSVLCYAAYYAGIKEEVLDDSMRIYHIEHETGSGWTPEGEEKLRRRMAEKGIPWLEWSTVLNWIRQMHRFHCPVIFNRGNWGLEEYDLPETVIQ